MSAPPQKGHRIFAAWYDRMARSVEKPGFAELRREVLAPAAGNVVEIGAGTGLNFAHYPPGVTEVVATEPDPHMLLRATRAAERLLLHVRVERAGGEELPFEDGSVDTVVGTLVLCTVRDQDRVLGEVRRVLKPGGQYLFLEHVRSDDPGLARWQDRLQPIWSFFGAGCHPNRDTPGAIERAGFELEHVERFQFSPNMILDKPHAKGKARKA